ncbi:hypothetical protein AAFC00_001048 [Neodothiora populina]|uniref:Glycoside hydrolase family 93 protein n=1 Tax=Neodothiora populina TaxID=2781224 RepID=A0ABR3PNN0_9PEZI
MHISQILLAAAVAIVPTALGKAINRHHISPSNITVSNVTIFDPPSNYTIPRTLYARTLALTCDDGDKEETVLATWENYLYNNNSNPYFPIYASSDGGQTWSERSRVYDQVNGWGLRYQPFLYELPETIGDFEKGTVLLAGNSIPDDLSETLIDVYASYDKGYTWTFISHVARGGEALPNNGLTPVWEPFLMVYESQIVCFYSDQRDPLHGQKLVHQVSSDLHSWGEIVNDVRYDNYTFRPGMTTVARLPGQNDSEPKYIMTYEFYGAPEADFAVYYRVSDSPLTFDDKPGHAIIADDGTVPVGSPYVVYAPLGHGKDPKGAVVVTCGSSPELFVHSGDFGPDDQCGGWTTLDTPEGTSYSRSLRVEKRGTGKVMVAGGGVLGGESNRVTVSVVDVGGVEFGGNGTSC